MNNSKIILYSVIVILFLGMLAIIFAAPKNAKSAQEVTYYMMSFSEKPGSKPFGCGEFLVPVKAKVQKADLKTTLEELVKAHSAAVAPYQAAENQEKLFGLPFFAVELVREPKKPTAQNPIEVHLQQSGKVQIGGVCDAPRATEPIRETINLYASSRGNPPVKIFLNGTEKEWRCFGDQSGMCL